jgi:hypothetical protein
MSEHKCMNCNTTIEVYYDPPGEILNHTSPDDEYICEDCHVKEYMHHRTLCMIMGNAFIPIHELEKLIAEQCISVKSLYKR